MPKKVTVDREQIRAQAEALFLRGEWEETSGRNVNLVVTRDLITQPLTKVVEEMGCVLNNHAQGAYFATLSHAPNGHLESITVTISKAAREELLHKLGDASPAEPKADQDADRTDKAHDTAGRTHSPHGARAWKALARERDPDGDLIPRSGRRGGQSGWTVQ